LWPLRRYRKLNSGPIRIFEGKYPYWPLGQITTSHIEHAKTNILQKICDKNQIKNVCLIQSRHLHHYFGYNLFLQWYCCKIAHFGVKQQSLTPYNYDVVLLPFKFNNIWNHLPVRSPWVHFRCKVWFMLRLWVVNIILKS